MDGGNDWSMMPLAVRTDVSPLVFVVKGDSPWNSLRQLVDDVKKDPAKHKYGTPGPGGVGSIAISLPDEGVRAGRADPARFRRVVSQRKGEGTDGRRRTRNRVSGGMALEPEDAHPYGAVRIGWTQDAR